MEEKSISFSSNSSKDIRKVITLILKLATEIKFRSFNEVKEDIVKEIKKFPNDTPLCDQNNDTLAHYSIKEDKFVTVHLIIEAYIDILGMDNEFFKWFCQENNENQTPIEVAAQIGNIEIIKYLYEIMIKTSEDDFKLNTRRKNIFHYAAMNNQCFPIIFFYEKLQNLFKESLIIDLPNENGITPLLYACIKGNKEVIDLLLDLGVDINAEDDDGNTCLHYAVKSCNTKVIKKLLIRGADKTKKNKLGLLPYQISEIELNDELLDLLKTQTLLQKVFGTKSEIKAIKGSRNNLLLLFLVMFFVLAKFIYLYRILLVYVEEMQTDFIPFVRDIFFPQSAIIFDSTQNFTLKEILGKCTASSSDYCPFETTIFFLSLLADIVLLVIITNFVMFNRGVEQKKKRKKETPSLADLFEKDNIVCVKCRIVIDTTTVHCIVCNACVQNYDHHCFWLNTCICQQNIKKFKTFVYSVLCFMLFNLIFLFMNLRLGKKMTEKFHYIVFNNYDVKKIINHVEPLKSSLLKKVMPWMWFFLNLIVISMILYGLIFMVLPVALSFISKKKKKEKISLSEFEANLLQIKNDEISIYSNY